MVTRIRSRIRRGGAALGLALLLIGAAVMLPAQPALAHCDSVSGPVVTAARSALAEDDVSLILPYIKAEAEAELTTAFGEAREAMQQGGKAAELAEQWFAETAVRLHRQGEGAAYTGLKYTADFGPALHAAEEAVESGNLHHVVDVLNEALIAQLEEKYHAIVEARAAAAREGTVTANRAAVEAALGFETFVDHVDAAIRAADHHAAPNGAEHDNQTVSIRFHEQELAAPALRHGEQLLLPLRAVAEAAGAAVTWDQGERSALVTLGELRFTVRPGEGGALLHAGSTMVPAEFLLDALSLHHELHGNTLELSQ